MSKHNFNGLNVECRDGKNDYNTALSIILEDEYRLKKLAKPGAFVIDVGAHLGAFTVLAASLGMEVTAVDILPENIQLTIKNLEQNDLNGTVLHRAIDKTSGKIIKAYYMDTKTDSGNHHEFVGNTICDTHAVSIDVETISLNELLDERDSCYILKLDCEGAEWPALEGISPKNLDKIEYILGEVHYIGPYSQRTKNDLLTLLHDKFEDVSAKFDMPPMANHVSNFILKRK